MRIFRVILLVSCSTVVTASDVAGKTDGFKTGELQDWLKREGFPWWFNSQLLRLEESTLRGLFSREDKKESAIDELTAVLRGLGAREEDIARIIVHRPTGSGESSILENLERVGSENEDDVRAALLLARVDGIPPVWVPSVELLLRAGSVLLSLSPLEVAEKIAEKVITSPLFSKSGGGFLYASQEELEVRFLPAEKRVVVGKLQRSKRHAKISLYKAVKEKFDGVEKKQIVERAAQFLVRQRGRAAPLVSALVVEAVTGCAYSLHLHGNIFEFRLPNVLLLENANAAGVEAHNRCENENAKVLYFIKKSFRGLGKKVDLPWEDSCGSLKQVDGESVANRGSPFSKGGILPIPLVAALGSVFVWTLWKVVRR